MFQFKKLHLQKNLCIQCVFDIESITTFINNIVVLDFEPTISETKCNVCHEETDLLYLCKDLARYFQEKVELFLRIILKKCNFDPSFQICIKCSYCVLSWNNIKEFFQNVIKNDEISEIIDDQSNGRSKHLDTNGEVCVSEKLEDALRHSTNNEINETANILQSTTNDDNIVDKLCSNKSDIADKLAENVERNKNDNITEKLNKNDDLWNVNKSGFKNTKTYYNKNRIVNQLKKVKTVGDQTLKIYSKLKTEIVSNKQLMIDKPFVKLKRLKTADFSCAICRKCFTTKYKTILHEFNHYAILSPQVELVKCLDTELSKNCPILTNLLSPNSNLNVSNTREDQECPFDIQNMLEVVYSDDEESNSQMNLHTNQQVESQNNDIIQVSSDEEDNSCVPPNNIVTQMHSYAMPYVGTIYNLTNNTVSYAQVFNSYLTQNNVINNTRTVNLVPVSNPNMIKNMLTHNLKKITQNSEPAKQSPLIRVRTDLF